MNLNWFPVVGFDDDFVFLWFRAVHVTCGSGARVQRARGRVWWGLGNTIRVEAAKAYSYVLEICLYRVA